MKFSKHVTQGILLMALTYALVIGHGTWLEASTSAPFLYYWAADVQAFVVERADGTDRQVLAPFTHPYPLDDTGVGVVTGPGWSPSGAWFAWRAGTLSGSARGDLYWTRRDNSAQRRYRVFRWNGERQRSLAAAILEAQWHPTMNLLLVNAQDVQNEPAGFPTYVVVLNGQGGVLVSIDTNTDLAETRGTGRASWSPDGQMIVVRSRYGYHLFDLQGMPVTTLHAPGTVEVGKAVPWLDAVRLAVYNPETHTWTVYNTSLRRIEYEIALFLPVDAPELDVVTFTPSPDGTGALVIFSDQSLWFVSFRERRAQRLSSDGGPLPERKPPVAWRGDSAVGALVMSDGNIALFTPADGALQHVEPAALLSNRTAGVLRWDDTHLLFVGNAPGHAAAGLLRYNTLTQHVALVTLTPGVASGYFSPLRNDLALVDGVLVDIRTGAGQPLIDKPWHGHVWRDVLWDVSGEWMITLRGDGPVFLSEVISTDGRFQRRLTYCTIGAPACYGWLPPSAVLPPANQDARR